MEGRRLMHHRRRLFALFVGCVAIAEASCGSDGSSRPEDNGEGGAGGVNYCADDI